MCTFRFLLLDGLAFSSERGCMGQRNCRQSNDTLAPNHVRNESESQLRPKPLRDLHKVATSKYNAIAE